MLANSASVCKQKIGQGQAGRNAKELRAYAEESLLPARPLGEAVVELMHRIHRDFKYAPLTTDISTPILEVFEKRQGVCQDFAHLMLGCLRACGIAARYVSGYLLTNPPPGKPRLGGRRCLTRLDQRVVPGFEVGAG